MDNQPAETFEKYNTENPGVGQGVFVPAPVLVLYPGFGPLLSHVVN
jgi:hypothetical protein